jgi:inosose dehydratase
MLMKIGFGSQLWLKDNHYENFHRMLDEMALIGFDGFEVCYPFLSEWYGHKPQELRKLLGMHGLELGSYYTGIGFGNKSTVDRQVEEFKRRCRFVNQVGGEYVLLDGGEKDWQRDYATIDEYIQVIAQTANELGKYAGSLGLTLAWHQHWGSVFEEESAFTRLMELTDPEWVGFCPDVGQLVLSGFDVLATVRRYIDRIKFVHYKDVTFAGRPEGELWAGGLQVPADPGAYNVDSRGRWVELGRGVAPFREITDILLSAGYDGWITDDFDFSCYSPVESAKACKDYLNLGLGIWGERDLRSNPQKGK